MHGAVSVAVEAGTARHDEHLTGIELHHAARRIELGIKADQECGLRRCETSSGQARDRRRRARIQGVCVIFDGTTLAPVAVGFRDDPSTL
jgi:hypothetical protein